MSVSIEKNVLSLGKNIPPSPPPKQNKKINRFLHCEKIFCLGGKHRPHPHQKKKRKEKKKKKVKWLVPWSENRDRDLVTVPDKCAVFSHCLLYFLVVC
jgi:hypothetical protein